MATTYGARRIDALFEFYEAGTAEIGDPCHGHGI